MTTPASLAGARTSTLRRSDRLERLLIPATFVTCMGNSIQLTAAALLVLHAERTALSVGWLFIAVAIPQAVLSLFFGRLADRFDRRMLCIACDLTSAAAAFALPVWLLLGGSANVGAYLVNFFLAIVSVLFMPASNALIKERVRPERLGPFNANFEIATQAGTLLSAAVGGFLVQLYGVMPLFFFNAVTFVASAVLTAAVGRRPEHASVEEPATGHEPGAATLSTSRPPLARLGLLYAVGNVIITLSNTMLVVLVVEAFQQGAGVLGVVDALAGVGILIAAAAYKRVSTRVTNLPIAFAGYLGCAAIIALEPFNVLMLMVLIPLAGLSFGLARISARTLLLRAVDERRAGRVFGATNAFGLAFAAAATVGIAGLADQTHIRYGFFALSLLVVLTVVGAVAALRNPEAAYQGEPAAVLEPTT
jgi:MFS family permease